MLNKTEFIEFLLAHQALQFGEFTLKSGRQSPYFFNLGVFNTGKSLQTLGAFYAQAWCDAQCECDVLFGPAYKGIPLVAATAIALYQQHHIDLPYCFNRKEKKTHGDGGELVGADLTGRVVLLDDVITAGTTVRETVNLMRMHAATLTHIIIAFDREERDAAHRLVVAELAAQYEVAIHSIITLSDVLCYLEDKPQFAQVRSQILAYRK